MRTSWPRIALAVAQAAVYGALASLARERSEVDAGLLVLAAVAQLLACVGVAARRPRLLLAGAGGSLLGVGIVWARLFLLVRQIDAVFGPEPGGQAWSVLAGTLVALPWVLAVPVAQLVEAGRGRYAALLLAGLVPSLPTPSVPPAEAATGPAADASTADRGARAAALYAWSGGATSTDDLPSPDTQVLLTPLRNGHREPATTVVSTIADAPATARRLLTSGPRDGGGTALLVDVLQGPVPGGWLRPGTDAPCPGAAESAASPALLVRKLPRATIVPGVSLPGSDRATCRYATAVASNRGVTSLAAGWSAPPVVTAATVDDAILAGAAHLLHNQKADGRFTYIVSGPGGGPGAGYNYPRHAGTAWFLARVALAFGEDRGAGAGADRALDHLATVSRSTPDGRSYVLDPDRRDGKSWIGTTALAALAQSARLRAPGGPTTLPTEDAQARLDGWATQLVASVAPDGKVLGDMRLRDATFDPAQPANAYGQGQVMLALATLAAHPDSLPADSPRRAEVPAALARTTRFLSTDYYGTGHPLYVTDEHWMCLTAHALASTPEGRSEAADGICATYLAQESADRPRTGYPRPAAGPAGGLAEAVVAQAWDSQAPAALALAEDYAALFLTNQYRPADSDLLGDAGALLGGFRDGPGDLDVQIDAVQHIGGALLGLSALLSQDAGDGRLP